MKTIIPCIAYAIVFGMAFFSQANAQQRPVVYELFTSQGCSSCPPADRVATALTEDLNILVLSYHIAYWDRLGWKDPFSSKAATRRQYAYASAMGTTRVYTPQGVVQGKVDVVGSHGSKVQDAIRDARKGEWTQVRLTRSGNQLEATLPNHTGEPTELLLVGYAKATRNAVPRGENAGRTLSHSNSVTEIQSLGRWDGKAKRLMLSLKDARSDGAALLIQRRGQRAIIGGGWL